MALKHNLSIMTSQSDPFWGVMLELNTASHGLFGWGIILIVFVVSSWVATKQTQDLGKSLLSGLWITTLTSLLLFFAGKGEVLASNIKPLVSEVMMLTMLSLTAISIAGMYFFRNKGM